MYQPDKGRDSFTKEHELLAEKILALHKKSPTGTIYWSYFRDDDEPLLPSDQFTDRQQHEILHRVKSILLELDLINEFPRDDDRTLLTKKGEAFSTFDIERKKAAKKEKEERIKSWPQRRWYLANPISFIIGGLFSLYVTKGKPTPEKQKQPSSQLQNPALPGKPPVGTSDTSFLRKNDTP